MMTIPVVPRQKRGRTRSNGGRKLNARTASAYGMLLFGMLDVDTTLLAQSKQDTLRVYRVDSVVVRATRTPESLVNIPMAASYVPAEEFRHTRGYELRDALQGIPGVFTQARSGHTDLRITIRGYGARGAGNRSNAGNMRSIRVLIDGIPETEPDGRTSLDLVHLDATSRVEVLRSNASTLYGSASGGVINLGTTLDFDAPFVETRNTAGSFNFLHNTVTAGTTFGSSRALLSVSNTTYGDANRMAYREHSSSSQLIGTLGIRSRLDSTTELGVYASATSNLFRFPGPLTRAQFDSSITQANRDFVTRDERRYNRQGRFAMTIDHGMEGGHRLYGSVFVQPKVLERSERNTYRDFNRYGVGAQARYQWKTPISSSIENTFSVGFDEHYQDGTVLFYTLTKSGSRGDTLQQNKQEGANALGGYVEETITLDRQWMLKLGGRYDRVHYIFRDFTRPEPATGPQEKVFTQFTPKGSLSYHFMSGHLVYLSVGGGVEAAAFNEVDPPSDSIIIARGGTPDPANKDFNPLLEPTTSTSFELGARGFFEISELLPSLNYDVAGYLISIRNDLVPWDGGRYYFMAAETRRIGVELGLDLQTSVGLSLHGALTVGESKYLKYENQLGRFDGNLTAGLPTTYSNLRLRYDAPLGLFAEATFDYVGSYYADDRNDRKPDGTPDPSINSLAPAYSLLGLTAGWRSNLGSMALNLFAGINNIADTKYVSSVFINGERNQYFEPGMPRNVVFGVALGYH